MASLSRKGGSAALAAPRLLLCSVRQKLVRNTPEERVRQEVLCVVPERLGCPSQTVSVEVSLRRLLPNVPDVPKARRVDIVCYACTGWGLSPVALIECKARNPRRCDLSQLMGYNYHIRAKFLAIAWPQHICLWRGEELVYAGPLAFFPHQSFLA